MGVPGLFRTLTKTLSMTTLAERKFPYVVLDFNCVLYEALRCMPERMTKDPRDEDVITHMVSYVCRMIRAMGPTRTVYLAIDGPVPMAKLECQRARRHKKVLEDRYRSRLHERFQTPVHRRFDSTKLTPGTGFMDRLVKRLRTYCPLAVACDVVISDHHVPGEGEHKLVRFLQRLPWNEPVCVYGLDADLIVLMLLLRKPNVYLARDPDPERIGVDAPGYERLCLLDVADCRTTVLDTLNGFQREHGRVVDDFCFLSLFGGNDFVRALPSTSVRQGGLDVLVAAYADVVAASDRYLIDRDRSVDWSAVTAWMDRLAQTEDDVVKRNARKYGRVHRPDRTVPQTVQEAFAEYEHLPYAHPGHPFHASATSPRVTVPFLKPRTVWEAKYQAVFELDPERTCAAYWGSVAWCWAYYTTNRPPTWDHVYPYRAAPLARWLRHHRPQTPVHPPGTRTRCYDPLTQLAYVIPYTSKYLLPAPLRELKPHIPIRMDYATAGKHIYVDPLLPPDTIERYETRVRESMDALAPWERARNRLGSHRPRRNEEDTRTQSPKEKVGVTV